MQVFLCDVLAETSLGYTKAELTHLLQQSKISIVLEVNGYNGYAYQMGQDKRDWL